MKVGEKMGRPLAPLLTLTGLRSRLTRVEGIECRNREIFHLLIPTSRQSKTTVGKRKDANLEIDGVFGNAAFACSLTSRGRCSWEYKEWREAASVLFKGDVRRALLGRISAYNEIEKQVSRREIVRE